MSVQDRIRDTIERRGGKIISVRGVGSDSEKARLNDRIAAARKRQLEAKKPAVKNKPRNWKPVPNQAGTMSVGPYVRRGGERGQLVTVKAHRRYCPMS